MSKSLPSHSPKRVLAFDRLRGLVMVLMTLDHAIFVFSGEKVAPDSAYLGDPTVPLEPYGTAAHFLSRWITHLCAPVFLFLVGASLAQSVHRRRALGTPERSIDLHLAKRGALLIAAEVWMALAWGLLALQVMWAIGATLVALIALRRLPAWGAGLLGIAWIVAGEALLVAAGLGPSDPAVNVGPGGVPEGLFAAPRLYVLGDPSDPGQLVGPAPFRLLPIIALNYPMVGWLAIALVGWWFGSAFAKRKEREGRDVALGFAGRAAFALGGVLLALAALQRAGGGYGNFGIETLDDHWMRWIQVSKYPPSLAFVGLELGLGLLILGALLAWERRGTERAGRAGAIALLGQTALFFYLIHIHAMQLGRGLLALVDERFRTPNLSTPPDLPLAAGWIATVVTLAILMPACALWRRRRAAC